MLTDTLYQQCAASLAFPEALIITGQMQRIIILSLLLLQQSGIVSVKAVTIMVPEKIKQELANQNQAVSRRRIGRVMKQVGLVSNYTKAQFKVPKDKCNESSVKNVVKRQVNNQPYRNVVVSDLTYVRVGQTWNYIGVLVDLLNREIIGYSAGSHKTAALVNEAFHRVSGSLKDVQIFHTDCGNEFKNHAIDHVLAAFKIERSLSHKGCPYDNAVAEAAFKLIKTEFVWNERFKTLEELKLKF